MKVINWILKALKWFKDTFELVKWLLALLAILTSLGWVNSCSNKNQEISNVTDMLTSKIDTFKTRSGLNAANAKTWEIKAKSLEKINSELSHDNNVYLTELSKAKQTIDELDLRLKDVKNYIKTDLVSKDSLSTDIIFLKDECGFKLEPIEKEFLSLRFEQDENFSIMNIDYESRNSISTILSIYPKRIDNPNRKRHGKKHFPNWALIWGWDHNTTTVVKDPNSKITNSVSIEFKK